MTDIPQYQAMVLADNQDVTRAGLVHYSQGLHGLSARYEVHQSGELAAVLQQHQGRAVVVLDYTLFDLRGAEAFMVMRCRYPEAFWVLFSSELSEDFIRTVAPEAGVSLLLKDSPAQEIITALQRALRGERYLCRQIEEMLLARRHDSERSPLTATETEVLRLLARGKTTKEIAAERVSSVHTIVTHRKNIFRKIGVNNVYEATRYALRAGLVELMEYYI